MADFNFEYKKSKFLKNFSLRLFRIKNQLENYFFIFGGHWIFETSLKKLKIKFLTLKTSAKNFRYFDFSYFLGIKSEISQYSAVEIDRSKCYFGRKCWNSEHFWLIYALRVTWTYWSFCSFSWNFVFLWFFRVS